MTGRHITSALRLATGAAVLAASIGTASAQATAATCDWSRPGAMDYRGEVPAAVDSYTDIPAATRARLKARMAARQYDEIVTITRDAVLGTAAYRPEIRDMHWRGGLCRGIASRAGWRPADTERGLVYCEDGHCILVPTVCRNVSRIQRLPPMATPLAANDEPIDINPSAGGTGLRALPPASGPGTWPAPWQMPRGPIEPQGVAWLADQPAAPLIGGSESTGSTEGTAWPEPPRLGLEQPAGWPEPVAQIPAPIPAVPEADTWLAMACGLAAVAWMARRQTARRDDGGKA